MPSIRHERFGDADSVRQVLLSAFGGPEEAQLVDLLRNRRGFELSLVAALDGRIVGHVLFTPVTIESHGSTTGAVALGPVGVLPEYQRKGIGSPIIFFTR